MELPSKYIVFDNFIHDVFDMEQFMRCASYCIFERTALIFNETLNIGGVFRPYTYVLPFRDSIAFSKGLPGIYGYVPGDMAPQPFFNIIRPIDAYGNVMPEYDVSNINDLANAASMQEIIDLDTQYKQNEFALLSSGDNIYYAKIMPDDTPEMALIKQAINAKKIDLDRYKARIGPTYNNDKRVLQKGSITFPKFKALLSALDLNCTLTITNSGDDVPNPIPCPLTVDIIDGDATSVMINNSTVSDESEEDDDE